MTALDLFSLPVAMKEVPQACLIHSAETHLLQPRADSGVRLEVGNHHVLELADGESR